MKDFLLKRKYLYENLSKDKKFNDSVIKAGHIILKALKKRKKLLVFGNGGSAAEAQHFAAELICKFQKERSSIPAIALTADSSIITAQSNDIGFEYIFSRQIEGLANEGDVVIGLTTSDFNSKNEHSLNIKKAFLTAKLKKAKRIGFFSSKTSRMLNLVDLPIIVPDNDTARVQEIHLAVIHFLCGFIEDSFVK